MRQDVLDSLAINREISYTPRSGKYRKHQLAVKESLINEAISWPGDPIKGKYVFTKVWEHGNFSVKFGKYGLEYYREGAKKNINDMMPVVFEDSSIKEFDASFTAIFKLIENLHRDGDTDSIIVLACLFIRDAFLVDHKLVDNHYRYIPPQVAIDFLTEQVGSHLDIPIEAFLQYVDAIAWQEDVKYFTRGYSISVDTGRTNNLLTYARFCACLLNRCYFADLLNRYSMGTSPLPKGEIATTFPELKTKY